jgi:uncharacterized membrane protein
LICLLGIIDASLALREKYRTDTSPCSINEKWDCGVVNKSPYAVFHGVPVAIIGICGYVILGGLALGRAWRVLFPVAIVGLAFSLYLTNIEAHTLGVWCLYCVISQSIIALITLLALAMFVWSFRKRQT